MSITIAGVTILTGVTFSLTEPVPIVPGDPYFANVSLLLHGDGTNGGTVFTDSSSSPKTIVRSGGTTTSTTQSKFGESSLYFNPINNYSPGTNLYTTAGFSDFSFPGDFTVELWVYPLSMGGTWGSFLIDTRGADLAVGTGWAMLYGYSGYAYKFAYADNTNTVILSNVAPTLNVWTHFAIVRSGSTIKMYINGVAQTATLTNGTTQQATTYEMGISANSAGSTGIAGHLDDVRITKGVARYLSDFAVPTAPFPDSLGQTPAVEYLVVGGGGGGDGGIFNVWFPGGGAGGTARTGSGYDVSGGLLAVTVGAGGNAASGTGVVGGAGGSSVFGTVTATGGGGGICSGTGASNADHTGGAPGALYYCGGAAGAGGNGSSYSGGTGGAGGIGVSSTITTLATYYGGGGGGGGTGGGAGGLGGGGAAVAGTGINGTDGLGGGAGGLANGGTTLAHGGSGVVIIRYSDIYDDPFGITGAYTRTVTGGYKIYTWTTSGTVLFSTSLPINSAAPVISGSAVSGSVLSCTTGTWRGYPTPTYSYQWKQGVSNIGTDSSTYTVVTGDTGYSITCIVTAINTHGSASATSNGISILSPPANTVAPVISGSSTSGSVLSCTTGTWTGDPVLTYLYQWKQGVSNIGTGSSTYTSVDGDIGFSITCVVTASNTAGNASSTSNSISVISIVASAGDSYFNAVSLLLYGNGTNGSTTITDSSPVPLTTAVVGNAQISTAQKKFGTGSIIFDGSGDWVNVTTGSEFNFGTGDFTIELQAWVTNYSSVRALLSKYASWASINDFYLYVNVTTGKIRFVAGNAAPIAFYSDAAIPTGQFVHVAVARASGVTRMFVNGVKQAASHTGTVTISNQTTTLHIGSNSEGSPGEPFLGYMDDIRVTKGVARYTSTFNPPTLESPNIWADPYYSDVSLLLHGNGTNGSTTFADNSPTPKTLTVYGNAQISTTQSKFGGASMYFDGTGDYASVTHSDFNTASTDWTVEGWVWLNAIAYGAIFSTITLATGNGIFLGVSNVGKGMVSVTNGSTGPGWITGTVTLATSTWYHLAAVRSGSTITLYVNGVADGTVAATTIDRSIATIGRIYTDSAVNYLNGYLDDVRFTRGIARYTAAFTPPILPFPDA